MQLVIITGPVKIETCKARITTSQEGAVMPSTGSEIIGSHSHGPDPARPEMLQDYYSMK